MKIGKRDRVIPSRMMKLMQSALFATLLIFGTAVMASAVALGGDAPKDGIYKPKGTGPNIKVETVVVNGEYKKKITKAPKDEGEAPSATPKPKIFPMILHGNGYIEFEGQRVGVWVTGGEEFALIFPNNQGGVDAWFDFEPI